MDGYPDAPGGAPDRLAHRDLYRYANQYFHEDYKPIGSGILNPMDHVLPPDYELFNGNIVRHIPGYGGRRLPHGRRPDDLSLTNALEAPIYDGNSNHVSLFEDSRKVQVLAGHRYSRVPNATGRRTYRNSNKPWRASIRWTGEKEGGNSKKHRPLSLRSYHQYRSS